MHFTDDKRRPCPYRASAYSIKWLCMGQKEETVCKICIIV
uniref:Uncharacterized protein n=1 Tax=Rhizophora mucronata TaxID=61149 RepID=A0A2P2PFB4_RHIMU